MTERDRDEEYRELIEVSGLSHDEAMARINDHPDLWILHPGFRYVHRGEEAVKDWEEAHEFLEQLADEACLGGIFRANTAAGELLLDARYRAWEFLRRAREQVSEGEARKEE